MPNDPESKLRYPCYFRYVAEGGFQFNLIDGKLCVCLFTSISTLDHFHLATDAQHRESRRNGVQDIIGVVSNYGGLIGRLKCVEADLAKSGIMHLAIDPVPGRPTMYVEIREFIEQLPP